MMQKLLAVLAVILWAGLESPTWAESVSVDIFGNTFVLPLKEVNGLQLYSPELGKGFPGIETTLIRRKTWRLSVGAAPVLGTSSNVPFVSVATRLSPDYFDISNNDLYFGVWAGKPSNIDRAVFGVAASVALW